MAFWAASESEDSRHWCRMDVSLYLFEDTDMQQAKRTPMTWPHMMEIIVILCLAQESRARLLSLLVYASDTEVSVMS